MDSYLDFSKQTSINRAAAAAAHAAGSLDSRTNRSSTPGSVTASRSLYGDVRTSPASNMHSNVSSLPQSPPIRAVKQPAVVQRSPIGDLGEQILSRQTRTNKNSIPALRGETAYWIRSDLRESPRIHELSSFALSHHHIISANRLNDFWKALNRLDKIAQAMPPQSSGQPLSPTAGSGTGLTESMMLRIAEQYKTDEYNVTIFKNQIDKIKKNKNIDQIHTPEEKEEAELYIERRAKSFSFTLTYDTMIRLINDPKGAFYGMLSGIGSGPKIFSVPEDYKPSDDEIYTDMLYESVLDALMARYQWMPGNLVAGPAKASMPEYMAEMGIQRPTETEPWYTEWARLDDCGGDFDKMAATIKTAPEVYIALDADLEKFINNARSKSLTEEQIQDLKKEALLLINRLAELQDPSGIGQDSDPDTIVRTGADWINTFEGAFVDTPQGRARYNLQKDEEEDSAMHLSICVDDFMAAFGNKFYDSITKLCTAWKDILGASANTGNNKKEAVKKKMEAKSEIDSYIEAYAASHSINDPAFFELLRKEIIRIENMEEADFKESLKQYPQLFS